jgi:protein TonB
VLDQHAQALLAGYGDLPPLPDALEANEIQVIVPINYKLRKTT